MSIKTVTVKMCPSGPLLNQMLNVRFRGDQAHMDITSTNLGSFDTFALTIDADKPVDFLEEVFELSNHPNRQADRDLMWGDRRSLSVGDVVEVDGFNYMCCSTGWEIIPVR